MSCAAAWDARSSGIRPLSRFRGPSGREWFEASAPAVDIAGLLAKPKDAKFVGRSTSLAMAAAQDALGGTSLPRPERVGIFVASGHTGLEGAEFFRAVDVSRVPPADDMSTVGGRPSRAIDPFFSLRTLANAAVHYVAGIVGAAGPSQNFVHSPGASLQALSAGVDALDCGECDAAVVVAHDCLILPSLYEIWAAEGVLRAGAAKTGVVPGEAGVVLIVGREGAGAARAGAEFGAVAPNSSLSKLAGNLGVAQPLVELVLWLNSRDRNGAARFGVAPGRGTIWAERTD